MSNNGIQWMDDPSITTESLFFGPSPEMREVIRQNVERYVAAVKHTVPAYAAIVQNKWNEVASSSAIQYIANMKHRLNNVWIPNSCRFLNGVSLIQQAPEVMRRWVMACPPIRSLFLHGGVDGYDKLYKDKHPGGLAKTHYDYRRVMDGVVAKDEETGVISYSNFYEANVPVEDTLKLVEKCSILATWDVITGYIAKGGRRDPTSLYNSTL